MDFKFDQNDHLVMIYAQNVGGVSGRPWAHGVVIAGDPGPSRRSPRRN
jgi:hypothetical protein